MKEAALSGDLIMARKSFPGGWVRSQLLFTLARPASVNTVCSDLCTTPCCIARYMLWLDKSHKETLLGSLEVREAALAADFKSLRQALPL